MRQDDRFDVGGAPTASGEDKQFGDGGDDPQWGQDGADLKHGGGDNDDLLGELGSDRMFGEAGEDAILGDRGVIADDRDPEPTVPPVPQFTLATNGPPFVTFTAFRNGTLHRLVV